MDKVIIYSGKKVFISTPKEIVIRRLTKIYFKYFDNITDCKTDYKSNNTTLDKNNYEIFVIALDFIYEKVVILRNNFNT